jgi:hypothetical protein
MTRNHLALVAASVLAAFVAAPLVAPLAPAAASAATITPAQASAAATTPTAIPTANSGPKPTSLERSADATSTTVLVHGLGEAAVEQVRENRAMRHSDLRPTGRFVKKGETLTVSVPANAPAVSVGIGLYGTYAAYNDGRDVGVTKTELKAGTNSVTASVDGMVTLISKASSGSADVKVSGGQAVPTFVTGQTAQADFVAELDRFPEAPFVEVIADRVFGDFQRKTAPLIASDDLEKRTKNWDEVVSLTNGVYGLVDNGSESGTARKAPHRIYIGSADTGAGYASATHERVMFQVGTGAAADLFRLALNDGWALWHEIGHTYQNPNYDFRGTSEMTVNISSLAVQVALGVSPKTDGWEAGMTEFLASPLETRDYSKIDHTSMGLWMLDQLRRGFGPHFYAHLHQELRVLTARGELPAGTDSDKKQILALYSARVADRDLTPFFDQWAYPLDDATRTAMAKLPPLTAKIWENTHSSKPIVDHELPAYAVPVGALAPATESIVIGQEKTATAPVVTELANSDGTGSVEITDSRVKSGNVGAGAEKSQVVLTNDRKVREVLSTPLTVTPGNSVLVKGQQNRPVLSVSIEPQTHQLRYITGTTYVSHSSWSGKEYVAVVLHAPDGRVIRSSVIKGNETAKNAALEADRQPYLDGQYLVFRHQQGGSGLFPYVDGVEQSRPGDTEQAFRLDGGRFVRVPLASVPVCDDSCTPALTAPERAEVGATVEVSAINLVPGERVSFGSTGETGTKDLVVPPSGTVTTQIRLPAAGVQTVSLEAPLSRLSLERTVLVGEDDFPTQLRSLVMAPTDSDRESDSAFTGVALTADGSEVVTSSAGQRQDALAFATTVSIPPFGASGPLQLAGNRCLVPTTTDSGAAVIGVTDCTGATEQRWQVGNDGTLKSLDLEVAVNPWWASSADEGDSGRAHLGSSATVRLVEPPLATRPLTATVPTVYNDARWAQVTGSATPGSTITIGGQTLTASESTGAWATTVKDLHTGENALEIRQLVRGHEVDSASVSATVGEPGPATLVADVDTAPALLGLGVSTAVPFVLENRIARNHLSASVELTAPAGTTFAGQTEVAGQVQAPGSTSWSSPSAAKLTKGTISKDGTTARFTLDWQGSKIATGTKIRWSPVVVAPSDAARAKAAMEFVLTDPTPSIGFHVDAAAPVEIDPATLIPGPASTSELKRGATTEIPVIVSNLVQRTSLEGTATFRAPEGTRFTGQSTIAASYRYNGSSWVSWSRLNLKEGTQSADGATMTFTFDTGAGANLRAGEDYRFLVKVATPADAPGGDSSLGYDFVGTSSHGAIHTEGSVATRLTATTPPAVSPSVQSPASGDTVSTSRPPFTGLGQKGAEITVGYGPNSPIGRAVVGDGGTWTFTPTAGLALGTSKLVVTQTVGAETKSVLHTLNRVATDAPFRVTSHADGQTYAEGIATFAGTASAGSTVTAVNQWGTAMGAATADSNGVWSFVRNLGPTALGYDVTFTAAKGSERQTVVVHLRSSSNAPVAVTSIGDGDTYRPGLTILAGTGTPGATISAVNATHGWNVPMGSAQVAADGTWALPERNWGPANDYEIKVTQVNPDATTSSVTVSVQAPR